MERKRLIWIIITLGVVTGTALVTYAIALDNPVVLQPGELSTAHEDIDCLRCHDTYSGIEDDLCLECHEDVPEKVWHEETREDEDCSECHYEHVGRDYITDHSQVPPHPPRTTELTGVHAPIRCNECHWQDVTTNECSSCHERFIEDTHEVGFTNECDLCHEQGTWEVEYDHEDETAECVDCHDDQPDHTYPGYLEYNSTCDACHEVDKWLIPEYDHDILNLTNVSCQLCHPMSLDLVHGGRSNDCGDCHLNTSWTPQNVDHFKIDPPCIRCHEGDMPAEHLDERQFAPLDCDSCHEPGVSWDRRIQHIQQPQPCIQCHGPTPEVHDRAYADDCQWCHITDQRNILKPHPNATEECTKCHDIEHEGGSRENSVDAAHAEDCGACHVAGLNFTKTVVNHTLLGQDCYACHESTHEPIGGWDVSCGVCHDTEYWVPVRTDHDVMGEDCLSCHVTVHPNGKDQFSADCTVCHDTEDWAIREWDHSLSNETNIECVNCHDDIHLGRLGIICEDCHVQDTWETDVRNP
jgi:predicted CXXCH cytochrome family protein